MTMRSLRPKGPRTGVTSTLHGWRRDCVVGVLALALAATAAAQSLSVGTADPARYLSDVKALTTPAMEGRGDGTQGLTRAARLLEDEYKRLGLAPAGTQGFFQPFQLTTGAKMAGTNELIEQIGGSAQRAETERGFCAVQFFVVRRSKRPRGVRGLRRDRPGIRL